MTTKKLNHLGVIEIPYGDLNWGPDRCIYGKESILTSSTGKNTVSWTIINSAAYTAKQGFHTP